MSDSALPFIIRFDTTANRIAFTPTPAVPEQLYIWLDSDDQPSTYYWDGANWEPYVTGGTGDVVGPASSVDDRVATFDGITGKLIQDGGMTIAQIIAAGGAAANAITALTGEVTATGPGSVAATIANNAVVTAKILDANVTDAKISNRAAVSVFGRSANSVGVGADIAAGADDRLLARTAGSVAFQQLTVGMVPNSIITPTQLSNAAKTFSRGTGKDGGGSVITVGVTGRIRFPVACTIIGWSLMADLAGDVEFDIFLDAPGSTYPPTTSIVASAPPELSGVDFDADTTLTGWTTSITAGDVMQFEIVGVPATITQIALQLDLRLA